MPPTSSDPFEVAPPEEALPADVQETSTEGTPASPGVFSAESFEQDPGTFAANAKAQIDNEARSVVSDGEQAVEDIPLSLGSTPDEVRKVDAETGFMAKLRGIGDRVLDIALDASDRIEKVISRVDKGVNMVAAAAVIGMGTVASTEVEPPIPPEQAFESQEVVGYWFSDNQVGDALKAVGDFETSMMKGAGPDGAPRIVDSKKVGEAILLFEQKIAAYPPELRKDILSDSTALMVLEHLDKIAAINGDASFTTDELLAAGEVKERAVQAAIKGVMTIKDDLVDSAAERLRQGDSRSVDTLAGILSAHVDNVAEYADISDTKEGDDERTQILRSVDDISLRVMQKLDPAYEQYRTPQKGKVLGYLAKAGYFAGVDILADKIASGKMRFTDVPGLFTDKPRIESPGAPFDDPVLYTINRGGELVSSALLKQYGLTPEEYMRYWQQPKDAMLSTTSLKEREQFNLSYNMRIETNIKNVVALERERKGSTKELATDYGIRFPGRYPVELLREQLDGKDVTRQNFGMAITTRQDWNGAFDSQIRMKVLYEQAKHIGSTVRVAEAEDAGEVMQRTLGLVDHNHGARAEFIKLGGHGSVDKIAMGPDDRGTVDGAVLGVGPNRTSLVLKEGAPVLLESCSTGAPGGVAERMSTNTSGEVIAPDAPAYISRIGLSRDTESGRAKFAVEYGTTEHIPVRTRTYVAGREVGVQPLAHPAPEQKSIATKQ